MFVYIVLSVCTKLGNLVVIAQKEGVNIAMINLRKSATTKDRPIMVDLIANEYKCNTLRPLNEVRVVKQLFWVSELVTASMDEVTGDALGTGVRRSTLK